MNEEIRKKLEDHEKRIKELEKAILSKGEVKLKHKKILSEKKSTEDIIAELIAEGFFSEQRTISQIRDTLHAKGRIVKITDLPPYLLKLVRNNMLKRERKMVGKRKTWVYFA